MKEGLLQKWLKLVGILLNPVVVIDLGTSETLIYVGGGWWQTRWGKKMIQNFDEKLKKSHDILPGLALKEPNVALLETVPNCPPRVIECGKKAKNSINKDIANRRAFRPIKGGVMEESTIGEDVVTDVVNKALRNTGMKAMGKITFMFAAPKTEELGKLMCLVRSTGQLRPGQIFLTTQPICAAVSSGILDEGRNETVLCIDNGGGNAHVSIMSSQGEIFAVATDFGGDAIDAKIIEAVGQEYDLVIEENEAQNLKHTICSALPTTVQTAVAHGYKFEFDGEGKPLKRAMDSVEVSSEKIQPYIAEVLEKIAGRVRDLQDKMRMGENHDGAKNTRGFLTDLARNKQLYLSGAGSQMHGMCEYFTAELGYNAELMPNPDLAVIAGASRIMRDPKLRRDHAKDKTFWLTDPIEDGKHLIVGDDVPITLLDPKATATKGARETESSSAGQQVAAMG